MLIDGADCHCAAAEKLGLDECAVCAANKAISPTAGRDLLERLEQQADRIQQMEAAIRLAIPEVPQATDYVVLAALEAALTPR